MTTRMMKKMTMRMMTMKMTMRTKKMTKMRIIRMKTIKEHPSVNVPLAVGSVIVE